MQNAGLVYPNLLDNIPGRILPFVAKWLFVMTGDVGKFEERIKDGKWPIYSKTHNRKEIKSGDDIIFYLGGKPNKKLMGKATLSSSLTKDDEEYSISVSNAEVWKKPLLMKELVDSLGFIKNKSNWGMHLQGGVIPLPADDYNKILSHIGKKSTKA